MTTHSSGLGSGEVADAVNGAVDKAVKSLVATACAQAQPSLDNMIQRKQELIDQLRTIDDHADAHFNNASFDPDEIVLSGIISLVGRKSPVISFDKTIAQDGYSALLSWFPGGWINRFDWTWSWSGRNDPGAAELSKRIRLAPLPVRWGDGAARFH